MTNSPIERYDQLPAELRNKISDLGPPTFIQIASLMNLGGLAAAIVDFLPGQRVDRIAVFVAELRRRLDEMNANCEEIERNFRSGSLPEGARLVRDGVTFAEKGVSSKRAAQIARIVAAGIATDELRSQRSRIFLSLLEDLTDIELAVLSYFEISRKERDSDHWRSMRSQLASAPALAAAFGEDIGFWLACVSKLKAMGLLEGSMVWGGEVGAGRTQEAVDTMKNRVDLFSLTTLGRELLSLVRAA
jgi:hypothetical protein